MSGHGARVVFGLALVVAMLAGCVPIQPETPTAAAPAAEAVAPLENAELQQALAGAYAGKSVTIGGPWDARTESELTGSFRQAFKEATGIEVVYKHESEAEPAVRAGIERNNGPDIMEFTWPGAAVGLARDGLLIDLAKVMPRAQQEALLAAGWVDWATMESPTGPIVAGFFNHHYLSGVIYYPKAAFEAAGYQIPTTWDEMIALSDQIVADGGKPWCIQNGFFGGSTDIGIPAVYWVEQILRHTTDSETYARWYRGELPFDSPEVRNAIEKMGQIWFNPDYTIVTRDKFNRLFLGSWNIGISKREEPSCYMMMEQTWLPAITGIPGAYGDNWAFFAFPEMDPAVGNPLIVEGHFMSVLNDRPEVRALMQYIMSGAHVDAWIQNGEGGAWDVAFSTLAKPATALHGTEKDRDTLAIIAAADAIDYDASGLIPKAVLDTINAAMADFVDEKISIDEVVQRVDDAWTAYRQQ